MADVFAEIDLPVLQPDPYVSVVVVEYNQKPETSKGLVAKTNNRGYSLTPVNRNNTDNSIKLQPKSRRGTIPESALFRQKQAFRWKLYIDQPGNKNIDISYSFQKINTDSKVIIIAANDSVQHEIQSTGKTVGEPNSDWVIDNFKSFYVGSIHFPEKGIYEIEAYFLPAKDQEIHYQWIWVK